MGASRPDRTALNRTKSFAWSSIQLALMRDMADAITECHDKVLVVGAKGDTFSAGGDVAELLEPNAAT